MAPREEITETEVETSNDESRDAPNADIPPDGGYGWVVVLATFMVNCFTWGLASQSYGVFLAYFLSHDLYPSATSLDFAIIGGFNISIPALVAPLVTVAVRKWGTRASMFMGVVCYGTGYVSASFAHEIWQLYIAQGVLVGAGIGFTYLPTLSPLSQWFLRKRGLANGIASSGSGIGGILFSFLTDILIRRISLGWAYRIEALMSCTMLLIATVLMRARNDQVRPTQRGFDVKLLKNTGVLLVLGWLFIGMFGYVVLTYSLPAYATAIGLSDQQASAVNAVMNVGVFVGRLFTGLAADRFGRFEATFCLTFLSGVMCFAIWMPATTYAVLLFYSIVAGATLGVFWVTIGPVIVEVVGLKELQSVLSLAWLVTVLPMTFAEVIALKIRKPPGHHHQYLYPQIFAALSYLAASVCVLALWWRKRKDAS